MLNKKYKWPFKHPLDLDLLKLELKFFNKIVIFHVFLRSEAETNLVKGLVLDHGGRHPDMPKRLENCHILTCNVSMEYEKTEVNSGFFYKSADEREKLVAAERKFIEDRVQKVIGK